MALDPLEANIRSAPAVSAAVAVTRKPREPVAQPRAPAGGGTGAAADSQARDASRAAASERRPRPEAQRERHELPAPTQSDAVAGARPVIAVRVGVPPVEPVDSPSAQDSVEAALRERAALRDLGQVLSLPPRERGGADAQTATAAASQNQDPDRAASDAERDPVVLLGSGASEAERPPQRPPLTSTRTRPDGAPRIGARDPSADRPAPEPVLTVSPEFRQQRAREQQTPEPQAESQRLGDAAAALGSPGTGAVRDPNRSEPAPQEIPLFGAGEVVAGPEAERAQRVATQLSGAVEARHTDELVSRFLAHLPPADPGPEPRLRRSVAA